MTTIDGNKLIAEFMGWKYLPETANHGIQDNSWKDKKGQNHYELLFHSSWDCLMPVVEKIGTIKPIELRFSVAPSCHIYGAGIKHAWEESQMKNIWLCCIEFIEWYNEQK